MKKQSCCDIPKLNPEIVNEANRWMVENKNKEVQMVGGYNSPRVSSEIADCSMPMTFDQYNYCSMGCLYCFAYYFKSNNPSSKGKEAQLKSIDPVKKLAAMQGKGTNKTDQLFYEHFYKNKFLLHWGGLADPFCGFEGKNKLGLQFIEGLGEMNYPALFSFKGDNIFKPDYKNIFARYSKQQNFAFQVSIITNSDKLSSVVEIGVPTTSRRLEALRMLSDMGYWTILRLRPFIIGISDDGLDELLQRALKAGIKAVSMEFFALDMRANEGMKTRYDWLSKVMGIKNLEQYFKDLSPAERGGYRRLNRLVKEVYVKKVYRFCAENGLVCGISDPDFKELNTSGSCCGMPDKFDANPLLENWTRSQLTYHLKKARQEYHKTGKVTKLLFGEVYGDESYLDEKKFGEDHIGTVALCTSTTKQTTQRIILQKQWNNLRSPANPRNYLHGKVMPCGEDAEGNIVYQYNPMQYEQTWKEEGIDLTR